MKTASDYAEVPGSPDSDERSLTSEEAEPFISPHSSTKTRQNSNSLLTNGMYILCLACCILNIAVMWRKNAAANDPQLLDLTTLDRPSVYVGLEKVKWSADRLKTVPDIANFPTIITQVSKTYPEKTFPLDTRRWLSDRGMLSPDEHQILITADVSTIVQFRILDYGMERCAVTFDLPDEATIRGRHRDNNLDLNGVAKVQVWELDTTCEIDVKTINKRNLPPRKKLLDTLDLKMGNLSSTIEFPCKSRSMHTYELACVAHDCRVMFWQDKDTPFLAVYMLQKTSLTPTV